MPPADSISILSTASPSAVSLGHAWSRVVGLGSPSVEFAKLYQYAAILCPSVVSFAVTPKGGPVPNTNGISAVWNTNGLCGGLSGGCAKR